MQRALKSLIAALFLATLASCTEVPEPLTPAGITREAASVRGYVVTSANDEQANRCATSVLDDFSTRIEYDPRYVEAYRSGASRAGVWAPTVGTGLVHHQGIQRLNRHGKSYFVVSDSTEDDVQAGLEIVEMRSRGSTTEALGRNVTPLWYPPRVDHIVAYLGDPNTYRNHAGGIQALGRFVITPFENVSGLVTAGFRIADLENPAAPSWTSTTLRTKGNLTGAGSAAMTRLSDGRFLALVFGRNAFDVEVFVSSRPEMPGIAESLGAWLSVALSETPSTFNAYQNTQLITECDGSLYLLGTYKSSLTCKDWADLFRVSFSPTFEPTFRLLASRTFACLSESTGGMRYCDFQAGAGAYVSGSGRLGMYGVEYYNYGVPTTSDVVKVREFF